MSDTKTRAQFIPVRTAVIVPRRDGIVTWDLRLACGHIELNVNASKPPRHRRCPEGCRMEAS